MPISPRHYFSLHSTACCLLLLAVFFLLMLTFQLPANHDSAWLLHQTLRLLTNDQLSHILPTLLPSDFILHLPAAWLNLYAGLQPLFAFKLAASVFLLIYVAYLYRQVALICQNQVISIYLTMPLALMCFPPSAEFAQRDHYVLIFLSSYILHAIARQMGRQQYGCWHIVAGMAGACAIIIKLPYAIVLALIELHFIVQGRSLKSLLRLECLTVASLAIAYFFLILHFNPYIIKDTIPTLLNFYWTYSKPWPARFLLPHLALLAMVLSCGWWLKLPASLQPVLRLAQLAIVGSYLAFVWLGNIWWYRQFPFVGLSLLFLIAAFVYRVYAAPSTTDNQINARPAVSKFNVTGTVAIIVLTGSLSGFFTAFLHALQGKPLAWGYHLDDYTIEHAVLAELPDVHSLFVMDTHLSPHTTIMLQDHYQWVSREHSLWMLPAWMRFNSTDSKLQARVPKSLDRTAMITDMQRFNRHFDADLRALKPDAIIVNVTQNKMYFDGMNVDFIQYFLDNVPYFRQIWPEYTAYKDYQFDHKHLRIYVRKDKL